MAIGQKIIGHNKTQRNLFAFLVAVEKYDQEHINNLYGCLNDLNGVEQFLFNYCKKINGLNFQPFKLENERATRRAIIEGFKFFATAQDGDICLFYFSGHGSRIDAPKEFRNESDKMLEAIVCYQENGNDNLLIDKELSFLIEEITVNKDIHFVAITDSCHSGSNTKNTSFGIRSCSDNLNTRNIDDYWGRSKYNELKNDKDELIRLSVPVGKHYKLSACTKKQLSKEKALDSDGEIRGVFTYALLRTLKECGTRLTYSNLMNKTRLLVQSLVNDQSPQLEVIKLDVIQRDSLFLNGALIGEKPTFLTHYDDSTQEWKVDIGSSYGVKAGDMIMLKGNNAKKIKIKDVKPTFSILYSDELTFTDRKKSHDCTILFTANRKLNLTFSDDSDLNIKQIVSDVFIENNSNLLSLNANNSIDYVIHAYQNSLTLTYPDDSKPVFCRIKRQNKSDIRLFISLIEKVAEWHRIVLINNEQSTIDESELDIKLSRVVRPYIHSNPDSADSTPFDNWKEENIFRYFFDDNHPKGVWHAPAFRLSITSKRRELWVSLLYCGIWYKVDNLNSNYVSVAYDIKNVFLEKELIGIKQTVKALDRFTNFDRNTSELESIELCLLDDYIDCGYNEIKDIIKIFVSTEELDTSIMNLDGIPIDTDGIVSEKPAGGAIRRKPLQSDWKTFEIPITIVKPRDMGVLNYNQSKSFFGMTIIGHSFVSARIILSTMEEFIRTVKVDLKNILRPEFKYGDENVQILKLTEGLGKIEGCSVIEFYKVSGINAINKEHPLKFEIGNEIIIENTHNLELYYYSDEDDDYKYLATMDEKKTIELVDNPIDSPSLIEGLGNSIKFFFFKVKKGFKTIS